MDDYANKNYRRNYTLGILNGALVNFGQAFVEPFTVIPVFITRLGGSNVVVGLATAAFAAFWFMPQVFVARVALARDRVLGIYNAVAVVRAAAYAAITVLVLNVGDGHPVLTMALVIALLAVSTLCAGIAGVPFLEVTTKTIPVTERGGFFGMRRFAGGLLGVVAGVIVAVVLGKDTVPIVGGRVYEWAALVCERAGITGLEFPRDYGTLFLLATGATMLGMVAFMFVREPAAVGPRERLTLRENFEAGFSLLRRHSNYRLFFVVRVAWQLNAMAFPFYAAYAYQVLGFSEATVGVFVSVWVGSGVVSNYVWGRCVDRYGNRMVLVLTAALAFVPPVVMLWLGSQRELLGEHVLFAAMATTFFLNGSARSGRFISNMTYLLESAPEQRRPLYVGFMNSISFPFYLSPVLGGLIVDLYSFQVLFAVAALFSVVSVAVSFRLAEPRGRLTDETAAMTPS